jgi:hypothetical protein
MFPVASHPSRYFPGRYFPKLGAGVAVPPEETPVAAGTLPALTLVHRSTAFTVAPRIYALTLLPRAFTLSISSRSTTLTLPPERED